MRLAASFLAAFVCAAAVADPTEMPKVLQSGRAFRDVAGEAGHLEAFRLVVPAGASRLTVTTAGGLGDCDIYVRRGAHPTLDTWDAAGRVAGNRDTVRIDAPDEGVWYVSLHGRDEFTGVRLVASVRTAVRGVRAARFAPAPGAYTGPVTVRASAPRVRGTRLRFTTDGTDPGPESPIVRGPLTFDATTDFRAALVATKSGERVGPVAGGTWVVEPAGTVTELTSGIPAAPRGGGAGDTATFRITIPDGRALRVSTSGGTGDTRMLVSRGAPPTDEAYDFAVDDPRNAASVFVPAAAAGDWYVVLRGKRRFDSVRVVATSIAAKADLVVHAESLGPYLAVETFPAESCEVVEGMIGPGLRRLLRFTTETRNVGGADMILGTPSADDPRFEYQACHGHYHFLRFATYRLLDRDGATAAAGGKVSFCLEDVHQWSADAEGPRYDCDFQGIQRGWSDVYDSGLPGQWVDVTGVPPGNYTLEVTVDPDGLLDESDLSNNTARVPVRIP